MAVRVQFLMSNQGHQNDRVREVARKLREREPDIPFEIVDGEANTALLEKHKLAHGPAVLINDRIEFVGIPRLKMLIARIAVCQKRADEGFPVNETYKIQVEKEDSNVVTLTRHEAAEKAPEEPR